MLIRQFDDTKIGTIPYENDSICLNEVQGTLSRFYSKNDSESVIFDLKDPIQRKWNKDHGISNVIHKVLFRLTGEKTIVSIFEN